MQRKVGKIEKMSKSKKNIVDPSDIIKKYGADTARWFMLSDSPPERDVQWSLEGVSAAFKFIQKLWKLNNEILNKKDSTSKTHSQSRPPTKVREDLIKGGVLLIVFLFAIFIIRKINEERSPATIENGEIIFIENPDAISDEQLVNDYVEAVSHTVAMPVVPPLKLKIVTAERIWYRMAADTTAVQSGILPPGEEKSLAFENQINVRLNQTTGTTLYINGMEVEELGDFNHPAEIQFFAEPSTITIKHYIPQR